jgi:hypothetical protein|tara:strand:- start:35 stop:175 length:141 start_codon:yes stop_codon:yes gene_type:complete
VYLIALQYRHHDLADLHFVLDEQDRLLTVADLAQLLRSHPLVYTRR